MAVGISRLSATDAGAIPTALEFVAVDVPDDDEEDDDLSGDFESSELFSYTKHDSLGDKKYEENKHDFPHTNIT